VSENNYGKIWPSQAKVLRKNSNDERSSNHAISKRLFELMGPNLSCIEMCSNTKQNALECFRVKRAKYVLKANMQ
jgi:hypothetical protein